MHNFDDDLHRSEGQASDPRWEVFYRNQFDDFQGMSFVQDKNLQRQGVDRMVHLSSGQTLKIEEKVRYRRDLDVLLEIWSSEEHKRPGWIAKHQSADYLAYIWVPEGKGLLVSMPGLQSVWRRCQHVWMDKYRLKRAPNRGYTTVSIPIPILEFLRAVDTYSWAHF